MIINHSVVLSNSWPVKSTILMSANREHFSECLNITRLETSVTWWFFNVCMSSYLNRHSLVVF